MWDRVILENGIVGYVFQSYLEQVPEVQITDIKLSLEKTTINKHEKIKLNVEVLPNDVENHYIEFSSSNSSVAIVDDQGYILGVSSGKSTITAISSNGISASIEITVYSPVTDIVLDIDNITLEIGNTFTLHCLVYPEDATNQEIQFYSKDENIAQVDSKGNITAINIGSTQIVAKSLDSGLEKTANIIVIDKIADDELYFDDSLVITANEISGLDYKSNTVSNIKNLITTDYEIKFLNKHNELLADNNLIGTGSKLQILKDGNILFEYQFILYGDVNGDGKINSVDLLVLQRHILEIEKFEGIFLKAGNINKTGQRPSSVDLLLIQRHILGLKIIEQ